MSLSIERARTKRRVTWLTVIGIILLPVLVGGVLVAALWNPTDRLDNIRAAIVNQDDPVTIDDQLVPLGRQLTAGLVEGSDDAASNVDWVISNAKDAESGIADGTYQATITIPKEFSAAATSTAGKHPEKASIDVVTSPDARVFDDVITTQIANVATSTMGKELSKTYLENVLLGFTTLHDKLGTAADGAGELAEGAKASSNGTKQLADGASALSDGAGQAAAGTHELADGASGLAGGARQSADGAGALASGLSQLSPGAAQLSGGLGTLASNTGTFADGATQLSGGLAQLADGAGAAVDGIRQFEQQVRDGAAQAGSSPMIPQELLDAAATGADSSVGVVNTLIGTDPNPQENPGGVVAELGSTAQNLGGDAANLGSMAEECFAAGTDPAFCQRLADAAGSVGANADAVGAAAGTVGDAAAQAGTVALAAGTVNGFAQGVAENLPGTIEAQLNGIADGIHTLLEGADGTPGFTVFQSSLATIAAKSGELAAGAHQIDGGVTELAGGAGQLSAGLGQTTEGANALAGGADQLASGASTLAGGASQLASGADQLATGTSGIADGSRSLFDGSRKLATGADGLASGLDDAVSQIPTYTEPERRSLADVVADPVTAGDEEMSPTFGGSAIPLLTILALWLGSLASYIAIQAVSRRSLASRAPSFLLTLKSFAPGAAIGAVQGVLVAGIVQFATNYTPGQWFAFAGLAALAGIAFAAVNQALVALFGGTGRWISALVGVLFFATGVVSTTPSWLTALGGVLPTGPAFRSLLTVVTPAEGAPAAITGVVLWLIGGLVLTTIAVARRRSVSARGLRAITA